VAASSSIMFTMNWIELGVSYLTAAHRHVLTSHGSIRNCATNCNKVLTLYDNHSLSLAAALPTRVPASVWPPLVRERSDRKGSRQSSDETITPYFRTSNNVGLNTMEEPNLVKHKQLKDPVSNCFRLQLSI